MRIGHFLSSEQHRIHALVDQAGRAEAGGFAGLWVSDHFHPWNDAQGHSPFVWSTIAAVALATDRLSVGEDRGGFFAAYERDILPRWAT